MDEDGRNKIVERQRQIDLVEDIVVPNNARSIINAPAEIVEVAASLPPAGFLFGSAPYVEGVVHLVERPIGVLYIL